MLGYKVCGECGLPITGGYSIGSLGAVHKSRVDCIRLLRAYADKLADALPEGGLPQDIETRRKANQTLAQENHELHAALDEKKIENERLRSALAIFADELAWDLVKSSKGAQLLEWSSPDDRVPWKIAQDALAFDR